MMKANSVGFPCSITQHAKHTCSVHGPCLSLVFQNGKWIDLRSLHVYGQSCPSHVYGMFSFSASCMSFGMIPLRIFQMSLLVGSSVLLQESQEPTQHVELLPTTHHANPHHVLVFFKFLCECSIYHLSSALLAQRLYCSEVHQFELELASALTCPLELDRAPTLFSPLEPEQVHTERKSPSRPSLDHFFLLASVQARPPSATLESSNSISKEYRTLLYPVVLYRASSLTSSLKRPSSKLPHLPERPTQWTKLI